MSTSRWTWFVAVFGLLSSALDNLIINRTLITFKLEVNVLHQFIEWQDGPCSPAKISQNNPLRSNEGGKMFLASRFDPLNEEFLLIVLCELEGLYSYVCPALVYFWAFPETSEHSLCTTNSCLSRMLPCLFFFQPP